MRGMRTALLISVAALALGALGAGCAKKNDDAQLATAIKAQMFSDPQTKDAGLQVAVKNGVVTLSGTVPSDAARYEAYKLATTTPGVTKVNDQTIVQTVVQTIAQAPEQPTQTAEAAPPVTAQDATPAPAPVATRERRNLRRDHARDGRSRDKRRSDLNNRRDAHRSNSDAAQHDRRQSSTPPPEPTPLPAYTPPPVTTPAPEAAAPPPPPPPQPITAIFPVGTTLEIQTIDSVDSSVNHVGDEFQATLAQPLTSAGVVVVPAGTNIYMRLTEAQASGQYKGRNVLQLQLARLEFKGREYPVASDPYVDQSASRGERTAKTVGGGAVVGAIIGAIAGGGKGAAIGAGVGGAGGGVYEGVSKVKPLRIAPETKLDFRLDQPLKVTYMPHHRDSSH